jgi:hypothetical protein
MQQRVPCRAKADIAGTVGDFSFDRAADRNAPAVTPFGDAKRP